MTQQPDSPLSASGDDEPQVVVVGPGGMAHAGGQGSGEQSRDGDPEGSDHDGARALTDLVEQPAKVMRIGSMIRQLLEEVKSAPLDVASRTRLADVYESSIKELEAGLAPELVDELERLSLPFSSDTPSEAELRVAKAQLVGWLEGLFHGIQTAIYAQQMAARAQLEQMRRALPPGAVPPGAQMPPGVGQPAPPGEDQQQNRGGMYL